MFDPLAPYDEGRLGIHYALIGSAGGLGAGRDEGMREKERDVARRALARGMAPAEVAELTGLSLEDVKRLAH